MTSTNNDIETLNSTTECNEDALESDTPLEKLREMLLEISRSFSDCKRVIEDLKDEGFIKDRLDLVATDLEFLRGYVFAESFRR